MSSTAAAKSKIELLEESRLKWPEGLERTRIIDRKPHNAWKKPWVDTRQALAKEMGLMGATKIWVTHSGDDRLDPGVAVWFSRKKEDFSWQQGLGLDSPAPTLAEIDSAYRDKAMKYHPDRPTSDPAMFEQATRWRDEAKAWITGTHAHEREYVMAIDQYNSRQLNLNALKLAFFYLRSLERVGAPSIYDQAIGAFRAKLTSGGGTGAVQL